MLAAEFDVREWAFFLAVEAGRPVGAATVATNTPEVRLDDGATWPSCGTCAFSRGARPGHGTALFRHAASWRAPRLPPDEGGDPNNVPAGSTPPRVAA